MGLFGPARGSIGETIKNKNAGIEKSRGRSASQIQAKKARKRQKQIREEQKRKQQEARDIKRAILLSLNGPPNAGKAEKFNRKAIQAGDKRRAKKAARKAGRRARGFWG